jgi:predicted HicB family RNase H-like nuclease
MQSQIGLYTRKVVRVPSLAEDAATPYRISLTRAGEGPDSYWLAEVDGLPGCSARGSTPEEAVQRAWTAALDKSASLAPIPDTSVEPSPPVTPRHSGKLLVRMPATLHDELARAAEAEGVSLNQLITGVLAGAVEWRGTRDKPNDVEAGETPLSSRMTRAVLAANLVVVLLAATAAVALLVVAWQAGL